MCVVWMASIIEMAAKRNEYTNIISRQYLCICTIHTTGARYTASHLLASLSNNTNITFAFVLFSLHILRFLITFCLQLVMHFHCIHPSIHPSIGTCTLIISNGQQRREAQLYWGGWEIIATANFHFFHIVHDTMDNVLCGCVQRTSLR